MSPASTPQLDVVLFDVDDTLYSTTEFATTARRNAVKAMIQEGLLVGEDEGALELGEVVAEFASNYEHHFDRLLDRLGPEAYAHRSRPVLIAAGIVAYHRTKEHDLQILPDAKALLEWLAGRRAANRVRVGVVTAGLQVKQAEKLIRLDVVRYLDPDAIFFSDEMGVSKPNPKIYSKACRALGVRPSRVLYVGDRPSHDVAPAHAIGLKTGLYRGAHGKWSDEPSPVPADHVVKDLREMIPVLEAYGL